MDGGGVNMDGRREAGARPGRAEKMPRRVHMIAVCGTGMGSLALLFREAGVIVTGSDVQAYPPMGDLLRRAGVEISLGFGEGNVRRDVDLVVVGNAVSRDNPEVEETLRRGLPYTSFPDALSRFFLAGRRSVVVAGTHGKTTSTALIAWLLECCGACPGFLVGGEPLNFGRGSRLGGGAYFVVEGDEYDTAFFDKGPKFLHYRPRAALFTSLEYDHADIFPDLASLREAFRRFVRLLPPEGRLMVCAEYPEAVQIGGEAACTVETYGYGREADWTGRLETSAAGVARLEVRHRGEPVGTFSLPLSGRHNGLNVLGSVGLLIGLGFQGEELERGVECFCGVRRRQEEMGEFGGVRIVDDFAHHPTAVRETLRGLRERHPDRRIVAVFEPRTQTSRRRVFQEAYVEAFLEADLAVCAPVYRPESAPLGDRFDPGAWVKGLREKGARGYAAGDPEDLVAFLETECRPGDLLVFMSSGNLSDLIQRLCRRLGR